MENKHWLESKKLELAAAIVLAVMCFLFLVAGMVWWAEHIVKWVEKTN